jgi:phage gp36-like protein
MAYCEQSDIEKLIPEQELAELTADTGSTPDAEVVTEAIAKADAEIDSYLGVVYTVPLSVPPRRRSLPRRSLVWPMPITAIP